jgi:hypothetical protein
MQITSISDEEIVNVVVSVRIPGLQREDGRVGRCVQLDDGLHRQRPVNEIGRLVIDVLHLDDHTLVVRIYQGKKNGIN